MSTLPAETFSRNTARPMRVTRSMTLLRAAAPFVRAVILASLVTALIMIGLPAVLAIARSASL